MSDPRQRLIANGLMLVTAAIWGFAFVGQREGMAYIGPLMFNGIRFLLGTFSLLPVLWFYRNTPRVRGERVPERLLWMGGAIAGTCLFLGATCQQIGLQYTTAGKAGFITGMYIIFVPLVGLFVGQRPTLETIVGACCAIWGLYLLSIHGDLKMSTGDLLNLIGSFFWTAHVLVIGWLSPKLSAIRLSVIQFFITGLISLLLGLWLEPFSLAGLQGAAWAIVYTGLMSTGIAYTLQVVAQQWAHASHAAIILSLEAMFAVLGGWLFLGETLSARGLFGCGLMLGGMIVSQVRILPGATVDSKA